MRDQRGKSTALCHPADASLPDCYRRVTVYKEQLGVLVGLATAPPGVKDIVSPDSVPPPDWDKLREQYEFLGGTADPAVSLIRAAFDQWRELQRRIEVEEQNGRKPSLRLLGEFARWEYRVSRMLGSRVGRTANLDRVAEREGWW